MTRPTVSERSPRVTTWVLSRKLFGVSVVGLRPDTGLQTAQIHVGQALNAPATPPCGPAADSPTAAGRSSVHPQPRERRRHHRRGIWSLLPLMVMTLLALPSAPAAAPRLRCEVDQGGKTQTIEVAPVSDPYGVQGIDINGRFRFKAVLVGTADRIDYVALYTWYLGDGRPVLLHEAKYQAPEARPDPPPAALTGRQYLYAPGLEREIQYGCALAEVAP
jgi:hypothetical protein